MRGEDVREVFESLLPESELLELARGHQLQERTRKLDVVRLLRAMVIAAATPYGGRQADVSFETCLDGSAARTSPTGTSSIPLDVHTHAGPAL